MSRGAINGLSLSHRVLIACRFFLTSFSSILIFYHLLSFVSRCGFEAGGTKVMG
jgi:hypothetical protein